MNLFHDSGKPVRVHSLARELLVGSVQSQCLAETCPKRNTRGLSVQIGASMTEYLVWTKNQVSEHSEKVEAVPLQLSVAFDRSRPTSLQFAMPGKYSSTTTPPSASSMSPYERISGTDDSEVPFLESKGENTRRTQGSWRLIAISFLLGMLAGVIIVSVKISYIPTGVKNQQDYSHRIGLPLIGRSYMQRWFGRALLIVRSSPATPGDIPVQFVHNETFALEPSEESDAAWKEVIPGEFQMVFYCSSWRTSLTACQTVWASFNMRPWDLRSLDFLSFISFTVFNVYVKGTVSDLSFQRRLHRSVLQIFAFHNIVDPS